MALPDRRDEVDEQELIERHVDLDFDRYRGGRVDARLLKSGVPIWAIVAYLEVYDGDIDQVADGFDLSREEMDAALAYYRRNKKYIDARILLNQA
jgi:uncharacterized protein (DUF433 family)